MLPVLKDGIIYPLPKVVYRMFDYTDVPEVSSCTEDQGTVFCFCFSNKECSSSSGVLSWVI